MLVLVERLWLQPMRCMGGVRVVGHLLRPMREVACGVALSAVQRKTESRSMFYETSYKVEDENSVIPVGWTVPYILTDRERVVRYLAVSAYPEWDNAASKVLAESMMKLAESRPDVWVICGERFAVRACNAPH
jgi:hypothetical protein